MLQGGRLVGYPEGANAKTSAPGIHGDLRESRRCQPLARRRKFQGHKRAFDVRHAVNPGVGDIESKKNAAWPKHAGAFGKSAILQLRGLQMMQQQDREHRRECAVRKWKGRRIALDDPDVSAAGSMVGSGTEL